MQHTPRRICTTFEAFLTMDACLTCAATCAASSWYPQLRGRGFTMKTTLLPLPPAFLTYLADGGSIFYPAPPQGVAALRDGDPRATAATFAPAFPALERDIDRALDKADGLAFVKLDWSAPVDAKWVAPGGLLSCANACDVYMLLKASDLVQYDLELHAKLREAAGGGGEGEAETQRALHLVLRPWYNVQPSGEFRVFIAHGRIIGVSQRATGEAFDDLEAEVPRLTRLIEAFVKARLLGSIPLAAFCADVYIDKTNKCWLMDLAPWGGDTEPLLFEWAELEGEAAAASAAAGEEESRGACRGCGGAAAPLAWPPKLSCDGEADEGSGGDAVDAAPPFPFRIVTDRAISFNKYAHHAYPDDLLNLVAAKRAAEAALGVGDGQAGPAPPPQHQQQGGGGGAGDTPGWLAALEELEAQGAFVAGGASSDEEDEEEEQA